MSEIRYRPAAGVASDFERLLRKFICNGSVRYESFAKIWREMKMSYVYAGRDLEKELKEFIEECLAIALRLFLPPYEFEMRVGGLYLLYALYHTQPFSPKVKVRVTLQQWMDVQDFHAIVKSQHHYDISFILIRLRLDKAFLFVASPTELHPSTAEREIEMPPFDVGKPLEVVSPETAEQVYAVHDQYSKMKRALAGPEGGQPDASLDVMQEDLPTAMMGLVKKYEDIAENRLIAQVSDSTLVQSSSGRASDGGRSAGTRRATVKNRDRGRKEMSRGGMADESEESGVAMKTTKAKRGAVTEPTRGRCRGRARGGSAVRRRLSRDGNGSSVNSGSDNSNGSDSSSADVPLARLTGSSSTSASARRQRGRLQRASASDGASSPAAAKAGRKKQAAARRKRGASTDSDNSDAYSVHDTSEGTDSSSSGSGRGNGEAPKCRVTSRRAATSAECERRPAECEQPLRSRSETDKTGDNIQCGDDARGDATGTPATCSGVKVVSGTRSLVADEQPQCLSMPDLT